jgi:hypothetical protein
MAVAVERPGFRHAEDRRGFSVRLDLRYEKKRSHG